MSSTVLALIPARGGSKGLPRKNLRLLAGKPLIVHTIEHALGALTITRTVVSTDDRETAEISRCAGAEVLERPASLAGDLSTDLEAFRHALESLGELPELVVHLRATTPIRRPERIDEAVGLLRDDPDADSLRSVSRAAKTPYKMWRLAGTYLEPALELPGLPEAHSAPRQLLPEVWVHEGYVDVIRPATILELESMAGRRVLAFFVEPGIDIDSEDDLRRAEALLATA